MTGVTFSINRRQELWLEFTGLYIVMPLVLAFFLPPEAMIIVLGAATLLGVRLLNRTDGFQWRDLLRGWNRIPVKLLVAFAVITAASSATLVATFVPGMMLDLPKNQTMLWLIVLAFYPLLSVLPQEVVFRPLFFERYGHLFPRIEAALVLNAFVFSLAHLMYWHWIVLAMTLAGGLVFGWAYGVKRNFPLALVLHSVSGQIVFTSGLGYLFYSGGVA